MDVLVVFANFAVFSFLTNINHNIEDDRVVVVVVVVVTVVTVVFFFLSSQSQVSTAY